MKILVIDDKAENREKAIAMLSEHEVKTISSYNEAIDLIHQQVNRNDVNRALGRSLRGGICIDDQFRAKEAELKSNFDFDIVFVDLMMPASGRTLGDRCVHEYDTPMPYGFPLMINIAMCHAERVKHIAIVSDVNHHVHAMSAALDPLVYDTKSKFEPAVKINGVGCWFIHSIINEDGSKNWAWALKRVISPKEVVAGW